MTTETGERPARNKAPDAPAAPASSGTRKSTFEMILAGLGASLSIGAGARTEAGDLDTGTRLAHERTDLAVERSYLAAERTLMAWIRTALSMISFGFTIGKLGQMVAQVEVKGLLLPVRVMGVESIAYFLVTLGTLALLAAILQHLRSVGVYAALGMRRRISIALIVGLVLVVMGGGALTALVMKL